MDVFPSTQSCSTTAVRTCTIVNVDINGDNQVRPVLLHISGDSPSSVPTEGSSPLLVRLPVLGYTVGIAPVTTIGGG